jgi:hypothetical protein
LAAAWFVPRGDPGRPAKYGASVFVSVRFFTIGVEGVDALKEVRERQIRVGLPDDPVVPR